MLSEQFLAFTTAAVSYAFVRSYGVNVYAVEASDARQTNSNVSRRTYHVVAPSDVIQCLARYADSDDDWDDDSDDDDN